IIFCCLIDVFFDGLCQPKNPGGIACYAFLIRRNGKIEHSEYGLAAEPFSKDSTNNVAEYTALIKALDWLSLNRVNDSIRIASDSKLVVSQLNGKYKVKSKRILPLYKRALILRNSFPDIAIMWVPREENREADALTNRAYKEALKSRAKAGNKPVR
ncbi:MAG: ribonuclease HI, partial [Nitrososphaera sp.]